MVWVFRYLEQSTHIQKNSFAFGAAGPKEGPRQWCRSTSNPFWKEGVEQQEWNHAAAPSVGWGLLPLSAQWGV